jgi:hypothetical protein
MLKAIGNIIGTTIGIIIGVILMVLGLVIFGLVLKVMWNFFMLGWRIL